MSRNSIQGAVAGSSRWLVASIAATMILAASPAQAGLAQFSQFDQTSSNQALSFTNNTTSGSLAYNSATQVNFSFTTSSGLDTINRIATMTLAGGPTTAPASSSGNGFIDQVLSSPLILKFTEVGGSAPGANLLTLTFTGDITGKGPTGSILGADSTGQTVVYTSDFLTFGATGNSYSFALGAITPSLSIGPGGFLNSFTANLSGQFSANSTVSPSVVPEPASLVLCAIASVVGLAVARARRGRARA